MARIVEGTVDDFSDGDDFWLNTSQSSLESIWDSSDSDVYAELIEASMSTTGETDEHIRRDS
jgi:hypothetical protein